MIDQNDVRFLEKRYRLAASWNAMGTLLLAGLIGLGVWLLKTAPGLAIPGLSPADLLLTRWRPRPWD